MDGQYVQLGAMGIILAFAIKEFFGYLKSKGNGGSLNGKILEELRLMNNNHLHTLQETLQNGTNRMIDTMHDDNIKMIEILGEIKGKLSK